MEERNRADTVDNVIFMQEAQALLKVLRSEKKNKVLEECYPKGVAHVS